MLEIEAELVQEIIVKAKLPKVKKSVAYFTQLPQRKYRRMSAGRAFSRARKSQMHMGECDKPKHMR